MIIQKVLTGSSIFVNNPEDADYIVYFDSNLHSAQEVFATCPEGEHWFTVNVNPEAEQPRDKIIVFGIMAYLAYDKQDKPHPVGEYDAFEEFYNKYSDAFVASFNSLVNKLNHHNRYAFAWWWDMIIDYIQTGDFTINVETIQACRNSEIPPWLQNKIDNYTARVLV